MPYTLRWSFSLRLAALAACASLTACGDSKGAGSDAGTVADAAATDARSDDADGEEDVDAGGEADASVTVPEWIFESCTSDSDCGASGTCSLAFAGGLCTYECVTHAACGPLGICANDWCYPACGNAQAGLGCENFPHTSTRCRQYSETRSYCTPACDPTPEGGEPACVAGTTCDPYSADWRNGACVTTPVTEGAENGEPCFQGANCRSGRCFPAKYESGTPTGWPDGACLSYGVQPSDAEYEAAVGGPMPTGSCPEGSAPFRTNGPGNETTCYASCASSADCRQGYNCSFLSGGNYTTGVCLPMGQ